MELMDSDPLLPDATVPLNFDFEKILREYDIEHGDPPDGAVPESQIDQKNRKGEKAVVCKHWLRGLCKKGEGCEFLHEYDLSRMPICYFFSKYGECSNQDCIYRHISGEENQKECAWYNRGFCKHGPNCRNKHAKRVACENYLLGFCIDGPNCKFGHPKYELPSEEDGSTAPSNPNMSHHREKDRDREKNSYNRENQHYSQHIPHHSHLSLSPSSTSASPNAFHTPSPMKTNRIPSADGRPICHKCGEVGHKVPQCPLLQSAIPTLEHQQAQKILLSSGNTKSGPRPLESVTCYKCGQLGHYADKCPNKRVPPPPNGYPNQKNPNERPTKDFTGFEQNMN